MSSRAANPANNHLIFDAVCLDHRGQRLIGPLSLTLAQPGITVLLGANGAGKSLTLRLAHGLLRPTAGRLYWSGDRPRQAFVHQRPILLRRTVAANLRFAMKPNGRSSVRAPVPAAELEDRLDKALADAGLTALAQQQAQTLSVGQQQRVALARAAALDPAVLFLDEPTASLDPDATRAVEQAIRQFADRGTCCLLSTHDLGQARRLADRLLFLQQGQVVEQADTDTFFNRPKTRAVQDFIQGIL